MTDNTIIASPESVLYDWSLDKMLEIDFKGDEEAFPKIRETLTRIGIPSKGSKTLTQTCNILQKAGKYYIIHFKEIYYLNKKPSTLTIGDVARRNRIANLLEAWGLCKIVDPSKYQNMAPMADLKIVRSSEKKDWVLESKQQLGNKSHQTKVNHAPRI
jgi:hypothetical protein